MLLDGEEEAAPLEAAGLVADSERVEGEPGPPPGGLGAGLVGRGHALGHQAALAQGHPGEQERHGELAGQPFQVIADLDPVPAAHVQEVDVVDHDEAGAA